MGAKTELKRGRNLIRKIERKRPRKKIRQPTDLSEQEREARHFDVTSFCFSRFSILLFAYFCLHLLLFASLCGFWSLIAPVCCFLSL